VLLIAMTGLWAGLAYPAWRVGGIDSFLACSISALLCTIPACLNVTWGARFVLLNPAERFRWMLWAKMVRLVFVLGGGFALYLLVPELVTVSFWVWVLVFYLPALALETWLLLPRAGSNAPLSGVQQPLERIAQPGDCPRPSAGR
jgi:hypothetical protein